MVRSNILLFPFEVLIWMPGASVSDERPKQVEGSVSGEGWVVAKARGEELAGYNMGEGK